MTLDHSAVAGLPPETRIVVQQRDRNIDPWVDQKVTTLGELQSRPYFKGGGYHRLIPATIHLSTSETGYGGAPSGTLASQKSAADFAANLGKTLCGRRFAEVGEQRIVRDVQRSKVGELAEEPSDLCPACLKQAQRTGAFGPLRGGSFSLAASAKLRQP